jgi:NADH-quinone oxidoreductase subunit N
MLNTINAANLSISTVQWHALMPHIIVVFGAIFSLLLGTFEFSFLKNKRTPVFFVGLLTLAAAVAWTGTHWIHEPMSMFNGMLTLDYFSSFFNVLLCVGTLLVMLGCYTYLEKEGIHYSEFYPLILIATFGMMLLASVGELISLFIALELMSLSVYVLVGMRRQDRQSNEASIKYFIMGGVGSAIYLYGVAMMYGALNTTKLTTITMLLMKDGPQSLGNPILLLGIGMVLAGFLFKVAVVPFHMWTPDVYEGAPTLITGYMATALKAAVFAAFIRVSSVIFGNQGISHIGSLAVVAHDTIWWLALATMIVGNVTALMQNNLKRLLAYSSIAHTGYLLVGILAGPKVGYSSMLLYLLAYVAMNVGAFGILAMVSGDGDRHLQIDKLAGFAEKHPWLAGCMSIFLLSLGGLPPTAGFIGKYFLFSAALAAGETWLVLLAVLTSVISVYYYLRVVVFMYMKDATVPQGFEKHKSYMAEVAIAVCTIVTIFVGLSPAHLLHSIQKAGLF